MTEPAPDDDRLALLAETAAAIAGEVELDQVLQRIVESAAQLTGARYAALGVIGEDQTIDRFITHGVSDEVVEAIGHYPRGHGILGLLIRDPQVLRLDELSDHPASYGFPEHHPPMHTFLGAPVRSGGRVFGNLYLTEKPGGFDETDERLLVVLSAQAGAAVDNAHLFARLQEVAVQDERDRISRDLHDGVIQSLFSIGMSLESVRGRVHTDPGKVLDRIDGAVDGLDDAIRELRNYIFRLRPNQAASMGLARGLIELAREYEVNALIRPTLHVQSEIDARIPSRMVPDLLQVVREALSNVAKHARATAVDVGAHVDDGCLTVWISDDGVGFTTEGPRVGRGLDNVKERAGSLEGAVRVEASPGEGTTVTVEVPLEDNR